MELPTYPCRLFVYLAREAPIGVVLRRGPSAWAQLSVWHTDTDTFEHGQWFKGRVYERRADVSADGSLFVYFAGQSGRRQPADSWIAISRPPYFTALALWFSGCGTYCSGGFFPGRRELSIGFGPTPHIGQLPAGLTLSTAPPPYIDRTDDWTERRVFINRLLRDGWEQVTAARETWQRRNPAGDLALVMTRPQAWTKYGEWSPFGEPKVSEYAVFMEAQGEVVPLGRATWADWDQRGRLVIAQDGRLFHWEPPGTLRELADFNPLRPDPAPAPAWAETWPETWTRGTAEHASS